MAAKQMDAITSFQHLIDNVPEWKSQLTELSVYAGKKYEEYVAEYKRIIHNVRVTKEKSESLLSIHSEDEDESGQVKDVNRTDLEAIDINPLEAGNRFIYAQAQRKRRAGTSLRSNASGNRGTRQKRMVVIYYDSHTQNELDKLAKAFGAARNNLRKGKNAHTASKGFVLPSVSRRYNNSANLIPNPLSKSPPALSKAKSDTTVITTTHASSPDACFVSTDKELEAIQTLCENAAHQIIRDGDCRKELTEAIVKLDVVLALATSTVVMLQSEKKQVEDETLSSGSSFGENHSTQSTLCEKPSTEAFHLNQKIMPSVLNAAEIVKRPPLPTIVSAPAQPLATDAIEVDDDDDDDDGSSLDLGLNFSRYRATSRQVAS